MAIGKNGAADKWGPFLRGAYGKSILRSFKSYTERVSIPLNDLSSWLRIKKSSKVLRIAKDSPTVQ